MPSELIEGILILVGMAAIFGGMTWWLHPRHHAAGHRPSRAHR